jgi:hypothetical protein
MVAASWPSFGGRDIGRRNEPLVSLYRIKMQCVIDLSRCLASFLAWILGVIR